MKATPVKLATSFLSCAALLISMTSTSAWAKVKQDDSAEGRNGNWKSSLQGAPSLEKCKKRVAANPKDADAQNDYGWALRQNGDLKGAEAALRESIRLNPDLAYSHSNLSVTLMDAGNKEEALQQAKKAVELDFKQPIFRVVLGNALAANGDAKSAIDAYKVAISIRPDYENAFYNLGRVLDEDGQGTEAKLALSQALNLDPSDDRVVKLLDQLMK